MYNIGTPVFPMLKCTLSQILSRAKTPCQFPHSMFKRCIVFIVKSKSEGMKFLLGCIVILFFCEAGMLFRADVIAKVSPNLKQSN